MQRRKESTKKNEGGIAMRKVLGGKERACSMCGSTVIFLKVKGLGTVSQCKECGTLEKGRVKDEVKIYTYDEKGELIID